VCNQSLIEYPHHAGSFRNTTIAGGVTGFALDLGVIDDYVKDRNEASSKGARDKTWNWFTDVFMLRFSATSGLLILCTRWHVDDLLGRYLQRNRPRMYWCAPIPRSAALNVSSNGSTPRRIGKILIGARCGSGCCRLRIEFIPRFCGQQ
jgi:hypothetical protein